MDIPAIASVTIHPDVAMARTMLETPSGYFLCRNDFTEPQFWIRRVES
jgi:hypothetical protein